MIFKTLSKISLRFVYVTVPVLRSNNDIRQPQISSHQSDFRSLSLFMTEGLLWTLPVMSDDNPIINFQPQIEVATAMAHLLEPQSNLAQLDF